MSCYNNLVSLFYRKTKSVFMRVNTALGTGGGQISSQYRQTMKLDADSEQTCGLTGQIPIDFNKAEHFYLLYYSGGTGPHTIHFKVYIGWSKYDELLTLHSALFPETEFTDVVGNKVYRLDLLPTIEAVALLEKMDIIGCYIQEGGEVGDNSTTIIGAELIYI